MKEEPHKMREGGRGRGGGDGPPIWKTITTGLTAIM